MSSPADGVTLYHGQVSLSTYRFLLYKTEVANDGFEVSPKRSGQGVGVLRFVGFNDYLVVA